MKVYLARHGRTQHNVEFRFGGITDVPVLPEGLAALRPASIQVPKVYVSPLMRTRQTASVLFPDAEQIVVPDLIEMNFGEFEAKTYQEMKDDPRFLRWLGERDAPAEMHIACPGGESRHQYVTRVQESLVRILDEAVQNGHSEVAIVAHGGTQMTAVYCFSEGEHTYYEGQTANGGCRVFDLDPDTWFSTRKMELVDTLHWGGTE